MKIFSSLVLASILSVVSAEAYQVTGPVLSMTDTSITVQKGKEKWEVAKSAATPVKGGEIAVGDKVTVEYTMTATAIEVKKDTKKAKKK